MQRAALVTLCVLASCAPPAPPPPAIGYFRANPLDVEPGDSVQLTWESTNAPSCTISPDVGSVPATGATLVNPQESTTYELQCATARRSLMVTVQPRAAIRRFVATPSAVVPEGVARLQWEAVSVKECALFPGIGDVEAVGERDVVVGAPTTFRLSCGGQASVVSAQVVVTVTPLTGTLTPPTDVTVTPHDGWARVSWGGTTTGVTAFLAEAPGVDAATVTTLPGGRVYRRLTSPFDLTGLVTGRTYSLRLAAASGATTSALTAEVSFTPVAQPVDDPLFSLQWHLSPTVAWGTQAAGPWMAGLRGEDVQVAVVDDGVDLAHEDLFANVLVGKSRDYVTPAPRGLAEHGTCVAGLIAARDLNGAGVRGVAPRVGLMSFNLLQELTSLNELDAMTREKQVVGVSNNSWGDAFDNTGQLTAPDPLWLRGVREGATTGRGGKGVVYFWAAGNGGDAREGALDDSNFDSQANSRFVIAVGGVGRDGKKPLYSENGANVLIVAPTEGDDGVALTTTDTSGAFGYNLGGTSGDLENPAYTRFFNGTSASTPVAAGVGALVLQARPELSYRDVRRVLARSARKVDAASPGWATNGAGLPVHHGYGFGAVDAEAAVALARTIPLVGPEVTASGEATPNVAVPDASGAGVTSSITITSSGIARLEFVEIEVTVTHARSSDLEVWLERSGGLSDLLHPQHTCVSAADFAPSPCAPIKDWVYGSVRHLDEPGDGTWTLRVKDLVSGTVGTLASWKLRLYGSN